MLYPLTINLKKLFPSLLLLLGISILQADARYEEVWIFGKNAGINMGSGDPVAIRSGIDGFGESNASVCDKDGQLLFYTEGSYIWDRKGNLMPGGSDLTGLPWMNTVSPTSSTSQGAIIIPMPDSLYKYYVFSLTSQEMGGNRGRLYYSIVDMRLNNGLGDVVPDKRKILVDSGLSERMAAVAGDQCNIWLLVSSPKAAIRAYEITTEGLSLLPVESGAGTGGNGLLAVGSMTVSPDRKKLAVTKMKESEAIAGNYGATLYDFDPATGLVSNPVQLLPDSAAYGICFSPDNSKLYVNASKANLGSKNVYQYHIAVPGIMATKTHLGVTSTPSHLKLAPDQKIYFITDGGIGMSPVTTMGRIDAPNLQGTACQYKINALQLLAGTRAQLGLPNSVPVFNRDSLYNSYEEIAPCFTGEVLLKASATEGRDFIWNDGTTGDQLTVNSSGTYWVSYKAPPCNYHVDTFRVTLRSPMPSTGFEGSGCIGEAKGKAWVIPAEDDENIYTYTWYDSLKNILKQSEHASGDTLSSLLPGNYIVHMHGSNGCYTTFSFKLMAPGEASFRADSIICLSDTLRFNNTSTPAYFTSWYWDFGDGATDRSPDPVHVYHKPGRYEVMLLAQNEACSDTAYHHVTIDPQLNGAFTLDADHACTGMPLAFTIATDSTLTGLSWDFGEGNSWKAAPGLSFKYVFDQPGLRAIHLTTHFRVCPDAHFSDTIRIYPVPKVNLGTDTPLCLSGQPIELHNRTQNEPGIYHNLWNTGDSTGSLKVTQPGDYSLTVISEQGCAAKETVQVKRSCFIDIPNAFTPNEDGVNDHFFPGQLLSRNITRFRMQVWNRQGQVVFETRNAAGRGWDGKFNGKEQPGAVYIYRIEVILEDRTTEQYQGDITLLR